MRRVVAFIFLILVPIPGFGISLGSQDSTDRNVPNLIDALRTHSWSGVGIIGESPTRETFRANRITQSRRYGNYPNYGIYRGLL